MMSSSSKAHLTSTTTISSPSKKKKYFSTLPGALRITTIVVGVCGVWLRVGGLGDDWETPEDASLPYVSYYGLGYKKEPINLLSIAILTASLLLSVAAAFVLATSPHPANLTSWNRFLHLSLSCLTFVGWLCGLLGFLQFRQGCCRVSVLSSHRITSPQEGYSESCLCLVTPTNDPHHQIPVLLPQDAPHDINFLHAQPHHANAQILSLILTLANVLLYLTAYFQY